MAGIRTRQNNKGNNGGLMIYKADRTIAIDDTAKIGKGTKIEPGVVIFENCIIGNNCIIGANAVLRPNTIIGNNTIFGTGSVSEGDNIIGNDVTIHAQCHLTKKVTVGNRCFIAPFFIASNTPKMRIGKHGNNSDKEKLITLPCIIGHDVRIGVCVSVIPGITIGHNSMIYQNTLITKDIPPFSIVKSAGGIVGRVIGNLE